LLELRGASKVELAEHSAELNRQRDRLAELVRDAAAPAGRIGRKEA
jgi:hypothetical protein